MAGSTSTQVVTLPAGGVWVALSAGETFVQGKATGLGKVNQVAIAVGATLPAAGSGGYTLDEDEKFNLILAATDFAYARSGDPTKVSEVTTLKRI